MTEGRGVRCGFLGEPELIGELTSQSLELNSSSELAIGTVHGEDMIEDKRVPSIDATYISYLHVFTAVPYREV